MEFKMAVGISSSASWCKVDRALRRAMLIWRLRRDSVSSSAERSIHLCPKDVL